jgi:hypothetical protein
MQDVSPQLLYYVPESRFQRHDHLAVTLPKAATSFC